MNFVDLYGKLLEMTPKMEGSIYREIHEIIQEEVVLDRDLSMMGLMARIGIKKGEPFNPDAKLQDMFNQAGPEALTYMIEQYHQVLNPQMWEGKMWSELVPTGAAATEWRYEFPSFYDYHARGALYYAIITSVKNYGTATFYIDLAETADGKWLEGSNNYKLVVPANVPVQHFWSVTAYDLESASYIRNSSKSSIDNLMKTVKRNADGSVDIYFGPKAPKGKESNWLPTDPIDSVIGGRVRRPKLPFSISNTRFKRFAHVIEARFSAGFWSFTALTVLPLPRFAGVTSARY